ncbi:putative transcription factor GRF family [Helianthus annuus]|uniref:Transcription factor GRF family n=1 Tax=Helianthus annuus TaxID=4232 RepID=A0A9K3HVQ6_HELAN|nr:putative transcription factor GRF family [Helianthus annuus]KAJ0512854.1 putative transcription factor GRF family [Helianthus annuus]KAJ0528977.1 putative transcription factor GRF family [Helianthus annuus]
MSSSSLSSSIISKNPKIFRLGIDGRVYCNHELVAIRRVARNRSSRQGEEFYGCPLWPGSDCKFFMWKQEFNVVLSSECNFRFVEMDNERLVFEKTLIEEENKSLKKQSKKACFVVVVCIATMLSWLY